MRESWLGWLGPRHLCPLVSDKLSLLHPQHGPTDLALHKCIVAENDDTKKVKKECFLVQPPRALVLENLDIFVTTVYYWTKLFCSLSPIFKLGFRVGHCVGHGGRYTINNNGNYQDK